MKRARFDFIASVIALIPPFLALPLAAQLELATIAPGPHTLYARWTNSAQAPLPYVWNGQTNEIQVSQTWNAFQLMTSSTHELPILQILETSTNTPHLFLYSHGNPIELVKQNGNWTFQGYPVGSSENEVSHFPLPPLRDAKIQVRENKRILGTYTWKQLVSMNPETNNIPISVSEHNGKPSLQISKNDKSFDAIALYPMFRSLTVHPPQTGIYVFTSFDDRHHPARNLGYYIEKESSHIITPHGRGYIGQCLLYILENSILDTHLANSDLIQFNGFHSRENTGNARNPYARWTARNQAEIDIVHPEGFELILNLSFDANRPDKVPIGEVTVLVNEETYPIVMQDGRGSIQISVPPQNDQSNTTVTINSQTWSPAEALGSNDTRDLGIMLNGLKIQFKKQNP